MHKGKIQHSGAFYDFRIAVETAQAESEMILVTRIGAAAQNGSWSAAAWLLQHRFPENWDRKNAVGDAPDAVENESTIHSLMDRIAKRNAA